MDCAARMLSTRVGRCRAAAARPDPWSPARCSAHPRRPHAAARATLRRREHRTHTASIVAPRRTPRGPTTPAAHQQRLPAAHSTTGCDGRSHAPHDAHATRAAPTPRASWHRAAPPRGPTTPAAHQHRLPAAHRTTGCDGRPRPARCSRHPRRPHAAARATLGRREQRTHTESIVAPRRTHARGPPRPSGAARATNGINSAG